MNNIKCASKIAIQHRRLMDSMTSHGPSEIAAALDNMEMAIDEARKSLIGEVECNVCKGDDLHCNYCEKEFIVEIEFGVYLANISGDPGRTVERMNAQRFASTMSAKAALARARKYRSFAKARIRKA